MKSITSWVSLNIENNLTSFVNLLDRVIQTALGDTCLAHFLYLTNIPTILAMNWRGLENDRTGTPMPKGQLCLGNVAGVCTGLPRCAERHQMYKPNRSPQSRGREQKANEGEMGELSTAWEGREGLKSNSKGEIIKRWP